MNDPDFISVNKSLWNEKTPYHLESDFYDNDSFLEGRNSLNEIELALLEDVKGKKILHLQCHFGQDTLSFARMGAQVTGIDFSDKAIQVANRMAEKLDLDAQFICCNVLEIDKHITGQFDLIYTSYGAICWLPELDTWAKNISKMLKPDGKFMIVEFHPAVWMFDYDFKKVNYSYFNRDAIIEEEEGTYAKTDAPIKHEAYNWNHSIGELVRSLTSQDFLIDHFEEYDYSPYDCFKHTVRSEKGFQIKGIEGKLPIIYSLTAIKRKKNI
ncbi:MAG: class I SAM-dependent methyltransferase [Cytophagales bacterium]|nr:class I SAM-dependent methyltransferase [Cytophagales bacterium]